MSAIATAASTEFNTARATLDCVEVLRRDLGGAPDYVMVHANAAYQIEAIREILRDSFPDAAVHGATSCLGAMTDAGVHGGADTGIAMWGINDAAGDFGTGAAPLGEDPREAAAQAVTLALEAADRLGELPQMIWLSASPGREELVLAGIRDVVDSSVPVVGGSAADNAIIGEWRVFDAAAVHGDGLVVSVLFSSLTIGSAFHNGYEATGRTAVVTEAEGRVIHKLDGRPARDVYEEWTDRRYGLNGEPQLNVLGDTTLAPLGRTAGYLAGVPIYVLSHPETVRADGGISLFTEIAVGDEIELMTGTVDGLVRRPVRVCDSAMEMAELSPRRIKGGILVYCAGCMLTVRDRMEDVHAGLAEALPGVPFITAFTFGEQGPALEQSNRHGNLMISAVLFGD